jgi:hypothetical protein
MVVAGEVVVDEARGEDSDVSDLSHQFNGVDHGGWRLGRGRKCPAAPVGSPPFRSTLNYSRKTSVSSIPDARGGWAWVRVDFVASPPEFKKPEFRSQN